jgi:hypothetical protein
LFDVRRVCDALVVLELELGRNAKAQRATDSAAQVAGDGLESSNVAERCESEPSTLTNTFA